MLLRAIIAVLFLFPLSLFANHIEGTYHFTGKNSDGSRYSGTSVITKTGSTYYAVWSFDDGTFEQGTGVLKDNFIAFHFFEATPAIGSGVILYEIHGPVWKGVFALDGSPLTGKEKAVKEGHDSSECSN